MRLVYTIVALSFSTSAVAVPPWEVAKSDGYCSAITSFEDDTIIGITLDWRTDMIGLYLFNEHWKSLAEREGGTINMHIQMSGNVEYDEWFDEKADIGTDGPIGFRTSFAKEHKDDFLTSWAFANAFTLRADDINLGSFTLRGSREAMLSLLNCANRALKEDRSDPFAK
ncbi:hypothetical protein [Sphingopyxis sp. Root1497]|uniref:hypothetical protein n=1 Tax=Sphingopyxis sp. Root1497 TaxID=1736474 RepID=UPI0012E3D09D|nr:hypothetical protein [Sphingopyxis sp. Root1497]